MDNYKETFINRLKELRTLKGWNQTELAKKANLERSMISNYENGKFLPSIEVLMKLAKVFNVSLDYFLFEKVQKRNLFNENTNNQVDLNNILKDLNSFSEEEYNSIITIIKSIKSKNT